MNVCNGLQETPIQVLHREDQLTAEEDEQECGFSDGNDRSEEMKSVGQSGEQSYGSRLQVYSDG